MHPLILSGGSVRLEPLELSHLDALCEVGLDPELWRWTLNVVTGREDLRRYIESAIMAREAGSEYPFVTIQASSGRVIGSTRYMNIAFAHRRLEIGSTWVAAPWQRSAINTEAKYLMLRHAFESLRCQRVELKTDWLNEKSKAAILRLGAVAEGVFRRHLITESGRVRDTAWYSILAEEWPGVKANLEKKMAR